MSAPDLSWQPSLFGTTSEVSFDGTYSSCERIHLDPSSWVDHASGWVTGSDELFQQVTDSFAWGQRTRRMFDKEVKEPRLTSSWKLASSEPLRLSILEDIRVSLSGRYGVEFDSLGLNLYRDGGDSVAWHRDHIKKEIEEPIVVLVSLGAPRRFLLRPHGGGPSRAFMLGGGDLLVTGGRTQRTWEHAVPKVANARPRISLAYRHHMEPRGLVKPKS